jgi:hypothetical protein
VIVKVKRKVEKGEFPGVWVICESPFNIMEVYIKETFSANINW